MANCQMVKIPSFGEYLGARGKYPGSPCPGCLNLVTIAEDGSDIYDFDVNGRCISYYPMSLMLFQNPQAIVFYHDAKLPHFFVDLSVPDIGRDFVINNTCEGDQSCTLGASLGQMHNIQKSIQRTLCM